LTNTRIFFVSDIHGSERLLFKFVNAGKVYKSDVLICGGDITGKTVTPIMAENGSWRAEYVGSIRRANTEQELDNLERDIRALGSYTLRTTKSEWDELRQNEAKMEEVFVQVMTDSLRRWIKVAEERLKPIGVKAIFNAGNDDQQAARDVLSESDYVFYPEGKIVAIDDKHEMASVGYSNMTPWNCPGDLSEEELAVRLEQAISGLSDPRSSLFNFHCPPYDTQIDVAPKLDKYLRPVLTPGGEPDMAHVGSTAVREIIEKLQPLAGLHGHIHESRGLSKIGKTFCFNPGSEYVTGVLRGLILNLSDKKIDNYVLTEG
jgi:Icc-related predicted phosphoesterase